MSRCRSALYSLGLLAALTLLSGGCAVPPPATPATPKTIVTQFAETVLDHYACYPILESAPSFKPPTGIRVSDQFFRRGKDEIFLKRELLCNPVQKDGSEYKNENVHLVCYSDQPETRTYPNVEVSNQFDVNEKPQKLKVLKERYLCVPSGKVPVPPEGEPADPPDPEKGRSVDHFKCYEVAPETDVSRNVKLQDQILTTPTAKNVLRAELLCNPAVKEAGDSPTAVVTEPQAHLVCYLLHSHTGQKLKFRIRNQFDKLHDKVELAVFNEPKYLCVPSSKKELTGEQSR